VLAEDALEGEPEALGGRPRAVVGGVALPLEATVAEVVEGMTGQEVDRLGRRRGALEGGAEPDVADLDRCVLGRHAQIADDAGRAPVPGHSGVEERIGGSRRLGGPGGVGGRVGEGAVGQEVPQPRVGLRAVRGRPQGLGVAGGVEGLEPHALALERRVVGSAGRRRHVAPDSAAPGGVARAHGRLLSPARRGLGAAGADTALARAVE
jgi:hypothetical protein